MFLQARGLTSGIVSASARSWNPSFSYTHLGPKFGIIATVNANFYSCNFSQTTSFPGVKGGHVVTRSLAQCCPTWTKVVCTPRQWLTSPYSTVSEPKGEDLKLIYRGPLSTSIKLLKIFSMVSSITVLIGSPLLIFAGNPGIPVISRIAISSIVCSFGVLTTFMLWWFTRSYVSHMWYSRKEQRIAVNTYSLFARNVRNEFSLKEAGPPANISSFATFRAKEKHYFLHTEVFENKQLLSNILGAYAQFENTNQQDRESTDKAGADGERTVS